MSRTLTIVAMADTHGYDDKLVVPSGDVLIHAGDLTASGTLAQLREANAFLARQPHRHKLVIAGNHDFALERTPVEARALLTGATYLMDEELTVEGLRIWGSPWQPWFYDWAFNLQRGADLDAKWRLIPEGIDVLVTHGPPAGFGDRCFDGRRVGCEDLLRHVRRVRPRLHLFGHIHEARGAWVDGPTRLVNVTTNECDEPATVLTIEVGS